MRGNIFDLLEFILLAFFAAVSGVVLATSLPSATSSRIIVLVATILLLVILLIQFIRKLRQT
ncbi:hypothetical protein ES705_04532 [subsurface metagenome]